jgi:hypothetical protein
VRNLGSVETHLPTPPGPPDTYHTTHPTTRPGNPVKAGRLANLSALYNWVESETSRTLASPVISAERPRRYLIPRTVTNRVHGPERPAGTTGPARM